MTAGRLARFAAILSPVLGLVGVGVWYAARPAPLADDSRPAPGTDAGGRLVVLAVFDQMRGDYPGRWAGLYSPGGFERIKKEGVWFTDARIPYAITETGPGHASIATGVPPSAHGIIGNNWFDPGRIKMTYCASSSRPYARVPSGPSAGRGVEPDGGLAPDWLLAATVGDALRAATNRKGRCFSLALKDRSAVLMGGKEPTGCYCFDIGAGEFVTSTYYRERPHPWVEAFNASHPADKWFDKPWDRLGDPAAYARAVGPDDAPGEAEGMPGFTRTFPHAIGAVAPGPPAIPAPGTPYYRALEFTPFANEMVWDLAKAGIEAEGLGRNGAADLLCLGFSATDTVGHTYGPDSQEVLDATLRADRLLADMLSFLDARLGAGRYTLVVTADHGICPLPENVRAGHPNATRFDPDAVFGPLADVLDQTFGQRDAGSGRWLLNVSYPWLHLNKRLADATGVPLADVQRFAAEWAGNRGVSQTAFPRTALDGPPLADPLGRAAQLSTHKDRAGDVYVVPRPGCFPVGRTKIATHHGSPHPYDNHVTLMAVGAGVPAKGERPEGVSSLAVAPIVCRALGIDPPAGVSEKVPAAFGP